MNLQINHHPTIVVLFPDSSNNLKCGNHLSSEEDNDYWPPNKRIRTEPSSDEEQERNRTI